MCAGRADYVGVCGEAATAIGGAAAAASGAGTGTNVICSCGVPFAKILGGGWYCLSCGNFRRDNVAEREVQEQKIPREGVIIGMQLSQPVSFVSSVHLIGSASTIVP